MPLAPDYGDFLCGRIDQPTLERPTVAEIAAAALDRWVLPRAKRYPQYADFHREQLLESMEIGMR